ncbi:hypothetical protein NHX12_013856, partial [Muraenolepis orangiensis]
EKQFVVTAGRTAKERKRRVSLQQNWSDKQEMNRATLRLFGHKDDCCVADCSPAVGDHKLLLLDKPLKRELGLNWIHDEFRWFCVDLQTEFPAEPAGPAQSGGEPGECAWEGGPRRSWRVCLTPHHVVSGETDPTTWCRVSRTPPRGVGLFGHKDDRCVADCSPAVGDHKLLLLDKPLKYPSAPKPPKVPKPLRRSPVPGRPSSRPNRRAPPSRVGNPGKVPGKGALGPRLFGHKDDRCVADCSPAVGDHKLLLLDKPLKVPDCSSVHICHTWCRHTRIWVWFFDQLGSGGSVLTFRPSSQPNRRAPPSRVGNPGKVPGKGALGPRYSEVVGGLDLIPQALHRLLVTPAQLNSTVKQINQSETGVSVFYQKGVGSNLTKLSADAVLVTSTAKATRFIDFYPPLTTGKRQALSSVHYDSATKIILTFRRRFWEDEGIKGGKSITDRPSRFIYYPSHSFPENPDIGVLLASYTWSDDSLLFLGLGDEELKEVALRDLVLIHGDQVRDLCTGVVVKKWSSDPYSLGAYAIFTPYQHTDFATELFQSEGRAVLHLTQGHKSWLAVKELQRTSPVSRILFKDCLVDKDYQELLYAKIPGHVVIVGTSMAGLAAAKLLQDAGHQVHVLAGLWGLAPAGLSSSKERVLRYTVELRGDQMEDYSPTLQYTALRRAMNVILA